MFSVAKKIVLAKSADTVTTELQMYIPKGYFGKIFPTSSLIQKHLVTVDAGMIDSDYWGTVHILVINCSKENYYVDNGERVAQIIYFKKEEVNCLKFDKLDTTERDEGGFVSTEVY